MTTSVKQKETLPAAEGQECAALTVKTLQSLSWKKVNAASKNFNVEDPSLSRKRKTPKRLKSGSAEAEFHATPKDYFRFEYFKALDLVINSIQDRFSQTGYEVYCNLQELLTKAATGEEYSSACDFIETFYVGHIDPI